MTFFRRMCNKISEGLAACAAAVAGLWNRFTARFRSTPAAPATTTVAATSTAVVPQRLFAAMHPGFVYRLHALSQRPGALDLFVKPFDFEMFTLPKALLQQFTARNSANKLVDIAREPATTEEATAQAKVTTLRDTIDRKDATIARLRTARVAATPEVM